MAQYLLALYQADDEVIPPERSRQVWARVTALRPIEVRPFFEGDLDDAIWANAPD